MRPLARLTVIGTAACALLAPAAAQAGTASVDSSGAIVYEAAPGEKNDFHVADNGDGRVWLSEAGGVPITPGEGCQQFYVSTKVACQRPTEVIARLHDGDDWGTVRDSTPVPVRVEAGDGNDTLESDLNVKRPVTLVGERGNDALKGWAGAETFDGGEGNDNIFGGGGADRLFGGPGDDDLIGDGVGNGPAPDVIDGGEGIDGIAWEWQTEASRTNGDVTATLAGGADDGRPGEGDDLRSIEIIDVQVGGTFTGSDADEALVVHSQGIDSRLTGAGGEDLLRGAGGNDTLDGGAGPDRLEGGYGDDALIGGPGADKLKSDVGNNACGSSPNCPAPHGNDTVEARDGEVDSIECGPGQDRVVADAKDVIAADCEVVERGPGPEPEPELHENPVVTPLQLKVKGAKLRKALNSGLTVTFQAGAAGKAEVAVTKGRKVVAKGARSLGKPGTYSTRVKFPKKVRKSLSRARKASFSITVTVKPADGSAPQTQTIKTTLKR